jgi:hypothetical protein
MEYSGTPGDLGSLFPYEALGYAACGMRMRAFCSIATEVFGYAAICGTGLKRLSRAISEAEARPVNLPVSYALGLSLRDNVGSSSLCMTIGR